MNIKDYTDKRKLEILEENKKLEQAKVQLTSQLQQVNARLIELNAELRVLDNLEDSMKPKKEAK